MAQRGTSKCGVYDDDKELVNVAVAKIRMAIRTVAVS